MDDIRHAPAIAPSPAPRVIAPRRNGLLDRFVRRPIERWAGVLRSPLNKRRGVNFQANRRGLWSLRILLGVLAMSLFAEFIANDKPILARYKGELIMPVVFDYPESKFGGFLAVTRFCEQRVRHRAERYRGGNPRARRPPEQERTHDHRAPRAGRFAAHRGK